MILWLDKTFIEENDNIILEAEFENYAEEISDLVLK